MRNLALATACASLLLAGGSTLAWSQQQEDLAIPANACTALSGRQFGEARIATAVVQPENAPVPGATIPDFTGTQGNKPMSGLPEFCRVSGTISAAPGSSMRFEVWLPTKGWDGRFTGANNGGLAGYVNYIDVSAALRAGQVGASTDTGHDIAQSSEVWAKGHPERVRDYGWRAIHLMTVAAKQVITAYYGRGPSRSYFVGCSNGGRQGLIEASRFPEDYDGILVGAPAARITGSAMAMIHVSQALSRPGAAIRPEQVKLLQAEVLNQCDALDGSKDGLVDDPRQCRFDYTRLACGPSNSPQCFTPPQLDALRAIHRGVIDRRGRRVVHGFVATGAESGVPVPFFGWEGSVLTRYVTPGQKTLAASILEDLPARPIASEASFNFDSDPARLRAELGQDLDASPDLRRFFARGGKMVMFHGWADPILPPEETLDFHADILRQSGRAARDNLRLFMVPGVQHCAGGPGPDGLGQIGAARPSDNPQGSLAAALRDWVEHGRVPETITGRLGGVYPIPGNTAKPKERLLCAWPKRAIIKPGADPDSAASYECSKG